MLTRPVLNLFCVIGHYAPETAGVTGDGSIMYYGMCRAEDIGKISHPMRSAAYNALASMYGSIEIRTLHITDNRSNASAFLSGLISEYRARNGFDPVGNIQKKKLVDKRVKCVETGKVYHSQAAAADAIGTARSTMSNHINKRDGYGSIHGFTFVKLGE